MFTKHWAGCWWVTGTWEANLPSWCWRGSRHKRWSWYRRVHVTAGVTQRHEYLRGGGALPEIERRRGGRCCFSEELGLRLRAEEWVGEFAAAREGEPKVQGRGEKGQLVYVAFWEFLSGSKWPELKNVGGGCGKMWLREEGRDKGFSQPCSGVFTKSWGEWGSCEGFSLEEWHDS